MNDGAALAAPSSDLEATQHMSFGANPTVEFNPPVGVNVQSETPAQFSVPTITTQTPRKGISPLLILSILGLLAIVGIAGIAGAYFVFVRKDNSATVVSSPTPTPTTTPVQNSTPDETRVLKDELEKLKKQVNDQKSKKSDSTVSNPPQQTSGTVTARVNSPGDGFLSLRTEPSVKTGTKLIEMPTGAIVQLEDCQRESTVVDTKRGRWCLVSYRGQTGWAFDAWLVR